MKTISLMILVSLLSACGSGNESPVAEQIDTPSMEVIDELPLRSVHGSFTSKAEIIEGEGFVIDQQEQNDFTLIYDVPFSVIPAHEVKLISGSGATLVFSKKESIRISVIPFSEDYRVEVTVIGQ